MINNLRLLLVLSLVLNISASAFASSPATLRGGSFLSQGASPIISSLSNASGLSAALVNRVLLETGLCGKVPVKNNTPKKSGKSNSQAAVLLSFSESQEKVSKLCRAYCENIPHNSFINRHTRVSSLSPGLFKPRRGFCESILGFSGHLRIVFSARDGIESSLSSTSIYI